jgi:L-gulonolactone oxidase
MVACASAPRRQGLGVWAPALPALSPLSPFNLPLIPPHRSQLHRPRCMPTGHYLLRFGKGSGDYMAPFGGLKDPVMVELSYLRDRTQPQLQAKFAWVQDAAEQLTLCKYKGRPHLGKNYDRTYVHPDCPVRDNLPQFGEVLKLQSKYDPDRVFEAPLITRMAARAPPPKYPGCALAKQCYCTEDAHCGEGFKCVPSTAFPQYKACRPAELQAMFG